MIYRSILKILAPIIKVVSKIYISFRKPKITGREFLEVQRRVQDGDVLLSYVSGEWSNLFNPGQFSHSALYVGDGLIVEAIGKGVRVDYLSNFCFKKDRVRVVRFKNKIFTSAVTQWAIDQYGRHYDLDFEIGDEQYYCHELVASSFIAAMPGLVLQKKKVLDGEFYTCDTFLSEPFERVIDTKELV